MKSWKLAYLRVLWAQKQCSKFQDFRFRIKKVSETQKCIPGCLIPLFCQMLTWPYKLWAVITFEQIISLCWNFQDNFISYIPFTWKSFIKIWDGSCPALVRLTWNDPPTIYNLYFWNILRLIHWWEYSQIRWL